MKWTPTHHRELGNGDCQFCNDVRKSMEYLDTRSGKIPNEVSTLAKIMLRCNNEAEITVLKSAERVKTREAMMDIRCLAGPAAAA